MDEKVFLKERDNVFWKRFSLSFSIILILPIAFFVFLFLQNYRQVYQNAVLNQAQNVLEGTANELEKELDNLQTIVSYNALLAHVKSRAVVEEFTGKEIIRTLAAETATHPILEDIEYYNENRPEHIFTAKGLYSLKYYVPIWLGKKEASEYTEQFKGIETTGWIVQNREDGSGIKRIQYVIKDEETGWWRFTLSLEQINEILFENESQTHLLGMNGTVVFDVGAEELQHAESKDNYVLETESLKGSFKIKRTINRKILFQEVETWQTYFFLWVALAGVVGIILVLTLTYYNANPLYKLQRHYKEKIKDIPNSAKGFEVFHHALKNIENQNAEWERKQIKNQIITCLIYGKKVESNQLADEMKKVSLFQTTEVYRVLAVSMQNVDSYHKLTLCLSFILEAGWEVCQQDTIPSRLAVFIIGMPKGEEDKLEEKLVRLTKEMWDSVNDEIRIYVGKRCDRLEDIHLSYKSAIICRKYEDKKTNQMICYALEKKHEPKFIYPDEELAQLYDALLNIDIEKASIITDTLLEFLTEQSQNRFVFVSLYYDVLNVYYRTQMKLEMNIDYDFLDFELMDAKDHFDAIQTILLIREQFLAYVGNIGFGQEAKTDKKVNLAMSKVVEYIDSNFKKQDFSVSMVADYFDMSISNLSHQFKDQTKCNILEYINEKKFEYAAELLKNTDYSVKVIADMLSYSQAGSFSRKFRKIYGVTPLEYRASVNEGEEGC